jgi:hypothetical protein
MLCEEGMINVKAKSALLVPRNTKHVTLVKTQSNIGKTNKHCTNYGMKYHNLETCIKNKEETIVATIGQHNQVKNHKRHLHVHTTFVV